MRSDELIIDKTIMTLRSTCMRAVPGCVNRLIETTVANKALDEDGETIIFGWVLGAVDDIYAKVWLTPSTRPGPKRSPTP
jgi:hypothetical protein